MPNPLHMSHNGDWETKSRCPGQDMINDFDVYAGGVRIATVLNGNGDNHPEEGPCSFDEVLANSKVICNAGRAYRALGVITRSPAIVKFLEENDPMALAQARRAMGEGD